jgi:SAM-dependent methyltransferase
VRSTSIEVRNPPTGFPLDFVTMSRALGRYDDTETTAAAIASLLPVPSYRRVLDVCCGTGRLAHALHQLGYDVVAFDLSPEQIDAAKQIHPGPHYEIADMRTPPVGTFDAAINVYTSFGYFETEGEDFAAISAWAAALRPGGLLLMELADMERARAKLDPSQEVVVRRTRGIIEEFRMDWASRVFEVTYRQGERKLTLYNRLYERERLVQMLEAAGFSSVRCFGDFQGNVKRSDDNLVIIATKAANHAINTSQ